MLEHEIKIQRYKQALAQWMEEYRCYGPNGTIAINFTEITQAKIKKLRSMIRNLEKQHKLLNREHEKIRHFIYDSNF